MLAPTITTNTKLLPVGTVFLREDVILPASLKLETSPCTEGWRVVRRAGQESIDSQIRAAGWNFFFTVDKCTGAALGTLNPGSLDRALRRILRQVQKLHFNAMEIDQIVDHKAWGLVSYIRVLAHARHIQRCEQLESNEDRKTEHAQSAWALGRPS